MRLKEIRGLPVIDPTAARKIGVVTDYQVDPGSSRIAALDISATTDGEQQRIVAPRIRRIGRSAVILTGRGGSIASTTPEVNERWLDTSTLVGLEVMGDDGNQIGRLLDATFNQDTLDIDSYLLRSSGWARLFGQRGRIQPTKVHSCSRELMMVMTGRVKELPSTVGEETAPLGLGVPLKAEDRLPAPSFSNVDGQPVGTSSR